MEAYRYIVKVPETGTIQIPNNPLLFNKDVEVIVLSKPETDKKKIQAIEFINKWAGWLDENNIDDAKFEYLSEKYK